uniref:Uncharacterized protein n=1 Tax=Coleochaete scutata TaxID=3125 RepID=A0A5P9NVV7_COLSC|nr:hypothetical protein [Coleochaete scutata]QFU80108.1 hypothetical protein [Coleochaete scutata]
MPYKEDLVLMNKFPPYFASLMATSIFTSATLSPFDIKYLQAAIPGLDNNFYQIAKNKQQQLDVLQIIVSKRDWFTYLDPIFWKQLLEEENPYYTLVFSPSTAQAKVFFDFSSRHSLPISFIKGDTEESAGYFVRSFATTGEKESSDGGSEFDVKSSIGSSYGIGGTGLPDRFFIFVNSKVLKPSLGYWYIDSSEKELKGERFLDQLSTITQNLGRFARKTEFEIKNPQKITKRCAQNMVKREK